MKVKELIEELKKQDPERLVVIADCEVFDDCNPLVKIQPMAYQQMHYKKWCFYEEPTEDMDMDDMEEGDFVDHSKPFEKCVLLLPDC